MRGNKFNARPVEIDGHRFPSEREAKRYRELKLLASGPEPKIRGLELQPRFDIVIEGAVVRFPDSNRPMFYKADFAYFEGLERIIEDSKGFKTPEYKIKRALVEHIYHVKIREV